jgi:HEAT repeat protein
VIVGDSEQRRTAAEIRRRLEGLRGQDLTDDQVEGEVRYLLDSGQPALPILLEQFREEDETLLAVATQALKAWEEPHPVEPLMELLRDPDVGDLSKALILNILERYGLDVDDAELLGLSINLEEYDVDSDGDGNRRASEG